MQSPQNPQYDPQEPKKSKKKWWIGGGIVLAILVIGGACSDTDDDAPAATQEPTTIATTTTAPDPTTSAPTTTAQVSPTPKAAPAKRQRIDPDIPAISTMDDGEMISLVADMNDITISPSQAANFADIVCFAWKDGATTTQVGVAAKTGLGSEFDLEEIGFIMGAATEMVCPQYSHLLG